MVEKSVTWKHLEYIPSRGQVSTLWLLGVRSETGISSHSWAVQQRDRGETLGQDPGINASSVTRQQTDM